MRILKIYIVISRGVGNHVCLSQWGGFSFQNRGFDSRRDMLPSLTVSVGMIQAGHIN